MLGFFNSDPIDDPALGMLTRHGKWWVGTLSLPRFGAVELRVAGGRRGPDPRSVDRAVALPRVVGARESEISAAFYEHYLPGLEVSQSGDFVTLSEFPILEDANGVWPHVRVERVEVDAAQKEYTVEIACVVTWDEEHTLGLRLDGDRVVELCGSIL